MSINNSISNVNSINNSSLNPNSIVTKGELSYVQFGNLLKYRDKLTHCFTTRHGGVSGGEFSELNFGLFTDDNFENVRVNYERISKELDFDINNIVFSRQVHGNLVRIVKGDNFGEKIEKPQVAPEFDAMVTASKNVVLTAFFADCVPVFFYDPINNVAGIAHSGWKSTVKNISRNVLECLSTNFNSKAENIEIAIGPSLGSCCFEVGVEVYEEFANKFNDKKYYKEYPNNKYKIDLWQIISDEVQNMGVKSENIFSSNICTKCHNDMFFSHRGQRGTCGRLAAFIALRD